MLSYVLSEVCDQFLIPVVFYCTYRGDPPVSGASVVLQFLASRNETQPTVFSQLGLGLIQTLDTKRVI